MKDKSDMNFEAKDFERYYSGQMSGREMHALEKAAMADPFLQEALEGYQYTNSAVTDLSGLQEKLRNRITEKKEAKIVLWNKNNFLKAAVLIAFLAGAAVIFLTQNNNRIENSNLASTSPAEIKQAKVDSNSLSQQNDLAAKEEASTTAASTPIIDLKKKSEEGNSSVKRNQVNNNLSKPKVLKKPSSQEEIVTAAAPVLKTENKDDSYLVKGKVVNEQGEPISFASIVTNKEQINTDIAGNYSAYIRDSSFYGNVVASGYKSQQKKLSPNLSQTIILNTDITEADKIADGVARSQSAKDIQRVKTIESKSAEVAAIPVKYNLAPENGWAPYEQYLKDSVRYQHGTREIVELSFTVNKNGRPQEIKVIDGLCLPCNTEAIRLLKDGPNWKPLPQGKGLLKVQF